MVCVVQHEQLDKLTRLVVELSEQHAAAQRRLDQRLTTLERAISVRPAELGASLEAALEAPGDGGGGRGDAPREAGARE